MRLGYSLALNGGLSATELGNLAVEAERLGYDSVWSSEIFAADPVAILAWAAARTSRIGLGAAVLQIPGRSALTTAASAATLQRLSGGRFRLGLGMSGPQVVEGLHGVAYRRPLAWTRDYVSIVRLALAGEPVAYQGETISLPRAGGEAVASPLIGAGRLKQCPLYLAGIGPKAVSLAGELADGWLGIHCPPGYVSHARTLLAAGARAAGRPLSGFDVAVMVHVVIDEDADIARDLVRPSMALYLGGMGSAKTNFYNRLACQLGFAAAAARVKQAYLAGQLDEAMAALPDDLIDEMTICGPVEYVRQRLAEYQSAGTTTLIAGTVSTTLDARYTQLAQLADAASGLSGGGGAEP